MSSTTVRIPSHEAEAVAKRFIKAVENCCQRVEIAGSLRRLMPDVGDIEIVAVPKVITIPTYDMFGNVTKQPEYDLLADRMEELLDAGLIQKRETNGHSAWGPKYRRLSFRGAPFDLFICDPDRYGLILAIRTGPASFSNALVTNQGSRTRQGDRQGLLPARFRVADGWLTERVSGERVPVREERELFELLKLRYVEPEDRR